VAIAALEGSLMDILLVNPDVVVTIFQVQLGEELSTSQTVPHLANNKQGSLHFFRDFIQSPVINTKTQGPSAFLAKRMAAPNEDVEVLIKPRSRRSVRVVFRDLSPVSD
jgi:hypothetical protein